MKRRACVAGALMLVGIWFGFGNLLAQTPIAPPPNKPIIPDIRDGRLDGELVQVEGFVDFWEEVNNKTMIKYQLRDDWANMIPVMSPSSHPIVKGRFVVKGTVNTYTGTNQRFIDEHERQEIGSTGSADKAKFVEMRIRQARNEVADLASKWWLDGSRPARLLRDAESAFADNRLDDAKMLADETLAACDKASYSAAFYVAIVAGVFLAALVIVLIVALLRRGGVSGGQNKVEATKVKGDVVIIHVPPPGTLKVLPGTFQVSGDTKVQEIRLFRTRENADLEFTFGRETGPQFKHIQLEHPTVSRDQMKLLFSNGAYTVINRADPAKSNATEINGAVLGLNETAKLADGDKITMGAVSLVYRANGK